MWTRLPKQWHAALSVPSLKSHYAHQSSLANEDFCTIKSSWSRDCWRRRCHTNLGTSTSCLVIHAQSIHQQVVQLKKAFNSNAQPVNSNWTASSDLSLGSNADVSSASRPCKWLEPLKSKAQTIWKNKRMKSTLIRLRSQSQSSASPALTNRVLWYHWTKQLNNKKNSWGSWTGWRTNSRVPKKPNKRAIRMISSRNGREKMQD